MRMCYIVLSSVAYPTLPCFLHYLINGTISGKTSLCIERVFWFPLQFLSKIFLIVRIIQRDIAINSQKSSCKVPVKVVMFYWNSSFLYMFSKNTQVLNTMKTVPVREPSCTVLTDGRTDVTKLRVAFGNFAKGPKNEWDIRHWVYPGCCIHIISYVKVK